MPKPLEPDLRAAIEQAIRDGHGARSAGSIAKEFGVARSTVLRTATAAGIEGAWDRAKTAHASRAKQIDNRSRRAAIVQAYLDDAERIRLRLWEPAEQMTVTGEVVSLTLPSGRDVRDFAMAGTALVKATIDVEKHDQGDQGADEAKSMLLGVAEGLRSLYSAAGMGDTGRG